MNALRPADFLHLLPLIFVFGWACLVLLASALGPVKASRLGPLSLFGLLLALGVTAWSWVEHATPATELFGGMLVVDRFSLFLDLIFLVATGLTILVSSGYLDEHRLAEGEYYALVLLSLVGMMLLVHAADFVTLLIGLETMSLGVYALAAGWAEKRKSAEAGLKYFVMGAVASAILLYGVALLYGVTGTTNLAAIARKAYGEGTNPLFVMGMFLVLGAMAFKVSLVPFHMWTPDAYEGAPTPVTGFMAAAVKAAGFGLLLRLVRGTFGADGLVYGSAGWVNIFWTLSMLTMIVGNLAALRQTNIKRMLAFSSVSHAGYLLLGVVTLTVVPQSPGPLLYYLLSYSLTTVGAFGVVAWLGREGNEGVQLEDWAGLGSRRPAAALAMTIFLLSLGGVPPTAGFFAKLYVFRAALEHPSLFWLVIIGALNSVVSIYYYLRPVVAMYFREGQGDAGSAPLRSGQAVTAIVCAAILVLLLGLVPGPSLDWAARSLLALP
ncbi:MAG: NADH-quinone oxidoreductase subunit N [Deltaproteobacteria bacterium]|nr:NADH-quinone oxidoreductase subunit N [Deltaproteobacteria bacterium]